ncbi:MULTISPECIES: Nif3-like dinuclear metal center hexameric protein [unclassified Thioalkalivibrio]|uniref:Nif3-like dinuclear metal center hexameric protein n=1 Tax=unclassified Thioalkalivibrio TaxID=2621013 RepID=UPI00036736EE|nr:MULTISPECIES: Nif3-like dinuclear metal center hexameric protein [unclassified Thioalkalivibrio]
MVDRDELMQALNAELEPERFRDYCPNGLQVEGRREIHRIVSGVTASLALVEAAVETGADLILVHHGYFWKGEPQEVTGMKRERLRQLLAHDINLVAYHLPLDAHPALGNNTQLAGRLGFAIDGVLREDGVGQIGTPARPLSAPDMQAHISNVLGREALCVEAGDHPIRRIAWCTGGAQSLLTEAAALGVDAYVSGEISEQTTHEARELGVHYFAAGHHATERYGAQALGQWCGERFGLEHEFIEIDNPA